MSYCLHSMLYKNPSPSCKLGPSWTPIFLDRARSSSTGHQKTYRVCTCAQQSLTWGNYLIFRSCGYLLKTDMLCINCLFYRPSFLTRISDTALRDFGWDLCRIWRDLGRKVTVPLLDSEKSLQCSCVK